MFYAKPAYLDQEPISGVDAPELPGQYTATSGDVLSTGFDSGVRSSQTFSRTINESSIYDEHNKLVKDLTGQDLPNPAYEDYSSKDISRFYKDYDDARRQGMDWSFGDFKRHWNDQEYRKELALIGTKHPEHQSTILPEKSFISQAYERARQAEQSFANAQERMRPGIGRTLSGLAGEMAGVMLDPVNIATLPLGIAGAGPTFWRGSALAAVKSGGINAATEAITAPFVQQYRAEAGLDYGAGQAAFGIMSAFALGAGLDLGIRSISRQFRAWGDFAPVVENGIVVGYRRRERSTPIPDDLAERAKAGDVEAQAEIAKLTRNELIPPEVVQRAEALDPAAIREVAEKSGLIDDNPNVRQTLEAMDADGRLAVKPSERVTDFDHAANVSQALRHAASPELEPLPVRVDETPPIPQATAEQIEALTRQVADLKGDVVGLAKLIKQQPETVSEALPVADGDLRLARNLAALDDAAFARVTQGEVNPELAGMVGEFVADPTQHTRMLDDLVRAKPSTPTEARQRIAEFLRSPDYAPQVDDAAPAPGLKSKVLDDPFGPDAKTQVAALEQQMAEELGRKAEAEVRASTPPDPVEMRAAQVEAISFADRIAAIVRDVVGASPDEIGIKVRTYSSATDLPSAYLRSEFEKAQAAQMGLAIQRWNAATTPQEQMIARAMLEDARKGEGAPAFYYDKAIWIASYAANPKMYVAHELIHALKDLTKLSQDEIASLAMRARRLKLFDAASEAAYRKLLGDRATDELIQEEAAAKLLEAYFNGRAIDLPKVQATILDRLAELFATLRTKLRQSMGMREADVPPQDMANQIIKAFTSGEIARRQVDAENAAQVRQAMAAEDITALAVRPDPITLRIDNLRKEIAAIERGEMPDSFKRMSDDDAERAIRAWAAKNDPDDLLTDDITDDMVTEARAHPDGMVAGTWAMLRSSQLQDRKDLLTALAVKPEMMAALGDAKDVQTKIENIEAIQEKMRLLPEQSRRALMDGYDVVVMPSIGNATYYVVPSGRKLNDRIGTFIVKPSQRIDTTGVEVTNAQMAPKSRRHGIGTALYNIVDQDWKDLGGLSPSPREQLSPLAQEFWGKRLGHTMFALSDLDMSPEARKQRAEAMGFDTKTVWYHGTKQDVESFNLRKAGKSDPGLVGKAVYVTPSGEQAGQFATSQHYGKGDTPNVMPLYLRLKNPAIVVDGVLPDGRRLTEAHPRGIQKDTASDLNRKLKAAGYDGVIFQTADGDVTQAAVFDPSNIRSVNAAFDPSLSDSPNLMFALSDMEVFPAPRYRKDRQRQVVGNNGITLDVQGGRDFGTNVRHYFIRPDGQDEPVGFVTVAKQTNGWEVQNVEVQSTKRGQGIATKTYDVIESDLGETIKPSGVLTHDGYAMWKRRNPSSVENHRQIPGEPENYYSPRQLLRLRDRWNAAGSGYASMVAKVDSVLATIPDAAKKPEALNLMFAFAGERAKTADLDALNRAKQMAADGIDRTRIWTDTGWFRGVDGKWRFEIDDSGARVAFGEGNLSKVLDHPDLYAAYPVMKNDYARTWRGVSTDAEMRPGVTLAQAPTRGKLRGAVMHEQQHHVQLAEGFEDAGGVAFTDPSNYHNNAGEVEARTVEKRINLTPEQRRARPPWMDYDVPESEQIVRFAGGDGQSQTMFALADADTGQSMRRDLDALGYYSKLDEVLGTFGPKDKITLKTLTDKGVKVSEVEARGLKPALDAGPVSVSDLIATAKANPVELREVVGGGYEGRKRFPDAESAANEVARVVGRVGETIRVDEYSTNRYSVISIEPKRGLFGRPIERHIGTVERTDSGWYPHTNEVNPDLLPKTPLPAGVSVPAKWQRYSLDPSNPSYRETVLHLPAFGDEAIRARMAQMRTEGVGSGGPHTWADFEAVQNQLGKSGDWNNFQSGHFPEPNIIGHLMTSMVKHEGKPVYLIDQIQSDWGQKLRDGGVRDEAKIADLARQKDQAEDAVALAIRDSGISIRDLGPDRAKWPEKVRDAQNRMEMVSAELRTAESSSPGNPLVNTTDQWTTTTLRRAIRQAAEADADYIAIPHGDTVLSYNPEGMNGPNGMREFYGSPGTSAAERIRQETASGRTLSPAYINALSEAAKQREGIVSKNLRKILSALDKDSAKPTRVEMLETPSKGLTNRGDLEISDGGSDFGFTLFPLTDTVKAKVKTDGQAMFALRDEQPAARPETDADPIARLTSRLSALSGDAGSSLPGLSERVQAALDGLALVQQAAAEQADGAPDLVGLARTGAERGLIQAIETLGPERALQLAGHIQTALKDVPADPRALAEAINGVLDSYYPEAPVMFALRDEKGRPKAGAAARMAQLQDDLARIEAEFQASGGDERAKLQVKRAALLQAVADEKILDDLANYRTSAGLSDKAEALMRMMEADAVTGGASDVKTLREVIRNDFLSDMDKMIWHFRKGAITGDKRRLGKGLREDMAEVIRAAAGEKVDNPLAQEFATSWMAVAEKARQRFNAAGGDIGKLKGWYAPQYHDAEAWLAAGQQTIVDYFVPSQGKPQVLDRTKMLNYDGSQMSDAELRKMIGEIWYTVTTGGANKIEPGQVSMGKGALYKQRAEHRVLHYASPDAWLAYNREFGGGDVFAAMLGHLDMMARDIAAMERFGPNPTLGIQRAITQIKAEAGMTRSAKSVYDDLSEKVDALKKQLRTVPAEATPIMVEIGRIHGELDKLRAQDKNRLVKRNVAAIEKLDDELFAQHQKFREAFGSIQLPDQQGILFKQISDMMNEMAALEAYPVMSKNPVERANRLIGRAEEIWKLYAGHTNTPTSTAIAGTMVSLRNWVGASSLTFASFSSVLSDPVMQMAARAFLGMPVVKQLGSYVSAFSKADRKLALELAVGLDQVQAAFAEQARFVGWLNTRHITGYLADRTHAFSLLSPMTQAQKVAFSLDFMGWMAGMRETAFGDLPAEARRMMQRHDVSPVDWEAMRAATPEAKGGRTMLTRDAIEATAGTDLADKYMTMMLRERSRAVIEPTLRGRTAFISETKPGTLAGEASRSIAMLKSFPTSYSMNVLGTLYGEILAGRGRSNSTMAYGAAIFVVGTIAGAMALQLKNIGHGRDPQDMTKAKFWMEAFIQSGGLGIFGDFIGSSVNRFGGGLAQTLAGPLAGRASTILDLTAGNIAQYANDEKTNFGREIVKTIRQNTPGALVPFYLRQAYERMLLDELQRVVDPDAYRSFQQQKSMLKKRTGQEYYNPPGGSMRAPNFGAAFGQ